MKRKQKINKNLLIALSEKNSNNIQFIILLLIIFYPKVWADFLFICFFFPQTRLLHIQKILYHIEIIIKAVPYFNCELFVTVHNVWWRFLIG